MGKNERLCPTCKGARKVRAFTHWYGSRKMRDCNFCYGTGEERPQLMDEQRWKREQALALCTPCVCGQPPHFHYGSPGYSGITGSCPNYEPRQ